MRMKYFIFLFIGEKQELNIYK